MPMTASSYIRFKLFERDSYYELFFFFTFTIIGRFMIFLKVYIVKLGQVCLVYKKQNELFNYNRCLTFSLSDKKPWLPMLYVMLHVTRQLFSFHILTITNSTKQRSRYEDACFLIRFLIYFSNVILLYINFSKLNRSNPTIVALFVMWLLNNVDFWLGH